VQNNHNQQQLIAPSRQRAVQTTSAYLHWCGADPPSSLSTPTASLAVAPRNEVIFLPFWRFFFAILADSVTTTSRDSSADHSFQSQSLQQGISDVPSLDHVGILRRREMLRDLVKQDRFEGREQGDEVSSSEDEKEMPRVDARAQLLGISRFLRRDLSTIDLQSAFLDEEGVQKRGDLFLQVCLRLCHCRGRFQC